MLQIFLTQALVIFILVNILFIFANYKKDNSIIDIFFGPLIFITSISSLIYFDRQINLFLILFISLFLAWAMRISLRIYLKNKGKLEDFRYKTFRDDWTKVSLRYFYIRSYLQIFILQGVIVLLMSMTATYLIYNSIYANLASFIFLFIALSGLIFEAISDMQLDSFIFQKQKLNFLGRPAHSLTVAHSSVENQVSVSKNNNKIMKSGLWAYSRHPNYFGEALFWWGLGFAAFTGLLSSPIFPLTLANGSILFLLVLIFISPILITYLLLYVSGVPMLEKKWDDENSSEWLEYKSKTPVFIPFLPKKFFSIIFILFIVNNLYIANTYAETLQIENTKNVEHIWYYKEEDKSRKSLFTNIDKMEKVNTILAPQTYHLRLGGEIVGEVKSDILKLAKDKNIKVMPLLANISYTKNSSEYFDQAIMKNLFSDKKNWDKVVKFMKEEGIRNGYIGW